MTPWGNVFLQISILIILILFQVDAAKVVTHFEGNGQVGNSAAMSGEDGGGQGKRWEELTRTFENPSNFRSVLNGPTRSKAAIFEDLLLCVSFCCWQFPFNFGLICGI